MPLTLTDIMRLVVHRDASAFQLELPDGHRTRSFDGVRPMKRAKYDLLPELEFADTWFTWLKLAAKMPEHFWWTTLKAELESQTPSTSCVRNLAHFFTQWGVSVAPFFHAVCRMAAERTRTDADPDSDDEELDDVDCRFADEKLHHKLSVQYCGTLGKLLPTFAAELAAASPLLQLWGDSKATMESNADWMKAIEYAATTQVRLGRDEMMQGLAQAARVITGDPTRQRAAHVFNKSQKDARTKWRKQKCEGKLTEAQLDAKLDKQRQDFPHNEAHMKLNAAAQGAKQEAHLQKIMEDKLAAAATAVQQPVVFSLPGTLTFRKPPAQGPPAQPLVQSLRAMPRQGDALASAQPKAAAAATTALPSSISIAPITINAPGSASNISVNIHVKEPTHGQMTQPRPTVFTLPSAAEATERRKREDQQRREDKERSRKRKREPKKMMYDRVYGDWIPESWDTSASESSDSE